MKNVVRSIWYELRKIRYIYLSIVGYTLLLILVLIVDGESDSMSGYVAASGNSDFLLGMFFIGILVGAACCSDFNDKVLNYEVLNGHSRLSVFMARGLFSIFFSSLILLIISFFRLMIGTMIYGWGDVLQLNGVVIRMLISFFPYLRISAFLVFVGFIIKNPYFLTGLGYLMAVVTIFCSNIFGAKRNFYLTINNMNLLTDYSSKSSSISVQDFMGTIIVSLIFIAIYLFAGYLYFRKTDLK